jgi:hypothetical protein
MFAIHNYQFKIIRGLNNRTFLYNIYIYKNRWNMLIS